MKKSLICLSALLLCTGALAGCGNKGGSDDPETGTGAAVKKASQMTVEELKEASKKEFEENAGETFKVVGLTSVLQSVMSTFAEQCDWVHYKETGEGAQPDNVYVKNDYKDYTLLTALDTADSSYFADYALVQDARSFSTYLEDGILHNYVPKDWQELGLKEEDTLPLKGVHFNKLFWTNTNFESKAGFKLYNIWQMAGKSEDKDHVTKLSFQTPVTEQINMSFLVSCYAQDNQDRIEKAYKSFYGKDWAPSGDYKSAGEQWVNEFLKNISIWHSSDGTAMKQTQLLDAWNQPVVYYGAFAKMKDAAKRWYSVDGQDTDPILSQIVDHDAKVWVGSHKENGKTVDDYETKDGVNAMKTVKWDWEIEGFNGFMYCMDSQIVNNAKYPYTACLFARILLEQSSYTKAIYNSANPDADGNAANQYGYYYPGTASADFKYAKGDWTKEKHIENEINEDYNYLKSVKSSLVQSILVKVAN